MDKLNVIAALGALSQETRLDIFRLLVQKGSAGMAAGEIGARLHLPLPTLSFHLNQLRYAALVSSQRKSRSIIYSANFQSMNRLLAYLTENCCSRKPEVCPPSARIAVNAAATTARPRRGRAVGKDSAMRRA